ncbi:hypothetical protein [Candidatus Contubernalis alkaliaceticus]|uniref:hypothetical protein n=1 Tax=Candidatus Contubernalis alkaliaceticus TaxID=338645 RepID=UPI001F4BDBE4|nr:hypothetical protein [Candidatus Contubernalis alkalaceticus]UNC92164.1 hypothetical protein HUE98_08690 [Candidatus Contubernalis alkalaceticus]
MFGIKKEEFLEKYFVEPGALLQVYNKTGSISITSWEQDYIEVVAVKQSVLGLFLDQVNIEVKVSDRIVISSEYSNRASLIVGVEYQIRVPEGILVSQVDNSTGSINVENVAGDVIAQT